MAGCGRRTSGGTDLWRWRRWWRRGAGVSSIPRAFGAAVVQDDQAYAPVGWSYGDSKIGVSFVRLRTVDGRHTFTLTARPYVWRRVAAALDALNTGQTYYLRDGRTEALCAIRMPRGPPTRRMAGCRLDQVLGVGVRSRAGWWRVRPTAADRRCVRAGTCPMRHVSMKTQFLAWRLDVARGRERAVEVRAGGLRRMGMTRRPRPCSVSWRSRAGRSRAPASRFRRRGGCRPGRHPVAGRRVAGRSATRRWSSRDLLWEFGSADNGGAGGRAPRRWTPSSPARWWVVGTCPMTSEFDGLPRTWAAGAQEQACHCSVAAPGSWSAGRLRPCTPWGRACRRHTQAELGIVPASIRALCRARGEHACFGGGEVLHGSPFMPGRQS